MGAVLNQRDLAVAWRPGRSFSQRTACSQHWSGVPYDEGRLAPIAT